MALRRRLNLTVVGLTMAALLVAIPGASPARAGGGHLLITEIVVTPTAGEFVEIHNPTGTAVDLSDVYLTDATFSGGGTYYYNIVTGSNSGGGGFGDWHSRFPAGAMIDAGEFQTISMAGSDDFNAAYGSDPTYELFEDGAGADGVPDMLEATPGSIGDQGGLSDAGEFVVLYSWDGSSDLVVDHDYAVWGDKAEAVDKTGISTDGPDADTDATVYLNDTAIAVQEIIGDGGGHAGGEAFVRSNLFEGTETDMGGNGVLGHDETSENLSQTWAVDAPSPGTDTAAGKADHLLITELAVTPTLGEFVEIYNPTAAPVDLTDVYLTDATFAGGSTYYYNIVTGTNSGGGGFGDWHSRFPAGATIGAFEYQTISMAGSDGFNATYGFDPTYELFEDGAADGIPDMLEATPGSINGQGGLSDAGEFVVLYTWDGSSDVVQDLDYTVWGDKAEAVDKTGISTDGPDADTDATAYLNDTAIGVQEIIGDGGGHSGGDSFQRRDLSEGDETAEGGNGLTGNDETSELLSETWGEAAANPGAPSTLAPPDPGSGGGGPGPLPEPGVCNDPYTTIMAIQGDGDATPLQNEGVVTEGVVTALLTDLGGFTIQDPVGDGDSATSDGIFVFADPGTLVVGDAARVVGHADEFFGLTELTSLTDEDVIVIDCGVVTPIAPTAVSFPAAAPGTFETLEGMFVELPTMEVTENFNLQSNGELLLSTPERLYQPTDLVLPGAMNAALATNNSLSSITMDDGSSAQNLSTIPFVDGDGTRRLGSMASDLTGVMMCNFGCHKFIPTSEPVFSGNERPDGPPAVGGDIKVATVNTLNFWTTFRDASPSARGADNQAEFERQTAKLVANIAGLGADVVALQELENNGATAIDALIDALNAAHGSTVWAKVPDPDYPGGLESTNAIKVGIIYRDDMVDAIGDPEVSEDEDFALDRPPVAQTFVHSASGEKFTVISNHFKSKSCSNTGPGEPFPDEADTGDGQACFAPRRTRMAAALIDFVAEMQALSGDDDVLAIGDLNSYAQEDPIRALREGGLVDLTYDLHRSDRYSFVFFGQSGQLDYAFATPEAAAKVSGAEMWRINIDEPRYLDYNDNNPADAYVADEFRSSDHDPLLIGFGGFEAEQEPRDALTDARDEAADLKPSGDKADDRLISRAVRRLTAALNESLWVGDDRILRAGVIDRMRKAVNVIRQVESSDTEPLALEIVGIARNLVVTAIEAAEATDGDADRIAKAYEFLAMGDNHVDNGRLGFGMKRYIKAWRNAVKAVEEPVFATYNASLNRFNFGDLAADVAVPGNAQAGQVAEIIQRTRPNVVLINEFDFDEAGIAAAGFAENYLGLSQNGADPIHYPYVYLAPSNTGIDSGFDLDNSGSVGGPGDAYGFGFFEGQFAMVVYSMHPIDYDNARTFQNFLWKDMPGALLPVDPVTGDWYSAEELDVVRLSSKSHWDVPVLVGRKFVHFLTSHPTPPVFDGPEDRNGTRNHDEIRFWADYIDPAESGYIYDDDGGTGGLYEGARFVIAGDQNSDPFDGDSLPGAANQLTDNPLINTSVTPSSAGGPEQAAAQGGINDDHDGDPAYDTADFGEPPGNLRVDYVLPSINLDILAGEVFWPLSTDPYFSLISASDHRLVWIHIKV
ncbi:MAG: ExeM/NucH family extracellular endonuclease [Acidimicrobiia bacterium]|nr:ExeM/NucH family extracellular endonuclease [Acidimicrobiia bacterium]